MTKFLARLSSFPFFFPFENAFTPEKGSVGIYVFLGFSQMKVKCESWMKSCLVLFGNLVPIFPYLFKKLSFLDPSAQLLSVNRSSSNQTFPG